MRVVSILLASQLCAGCIGWDELRDGYAHLPAGVVPGTATLSFEAGAQVLIDTTERTIVVDGVELTLPSGASFVPVRSTGGEGLAVLAVDDFDLPEQASLRAVGSRALVVLAGGDISIAGDMDAGGIGNESGAGAVVSLPARGKDAYFAGRASMDGAKDAFTGAGGGGHRDMGGTAGRSILVHDGNEEVANENAGGEAYGDEKLSSLLGGGAGGRGRAESCPGGGGGGAVQLSADGVLRVSGTIRVSGGGGTHGCDCEESGGAGGGAGGALFLQSPQIDMLGEIAANGGGGGGGCIPGSHDDEIYTAGEDGRVDQSAAQGSNGVGGDAADGGDGGADAQPPTEGFTDIWGGGGGGARGYIVLFGDSSPALQGTSSPEAFLVR